MDGIYLEILFLVLSIAAAVVGGFLFGSAMAESERQRRKLLEHRPIRHIKGAGYDSVWDALNRDWEAIGGDFRRAMDQVDDELRKAGKVPPKRI